MEYKTRSFVVVGFNFEEVGVYLLDGFQFYLGDGLLLVVEFEESEDVVAVAVLLEEFFAAAVAEGELVVVGALLEQELDDLEVELALGLVHLHLGTAEVVDQRVPVLLVNDPVHVSPVLDQQLRNQEADLLVFEAGGLLHQSEQRGRERSLVHEVGLVDFRVGKEKQPHDFVVAADAGSDEGSLFVVLCFEIHVDQLVLE